DDAELVVKPAWTEAEVHETAVVLLNLLGIPLGDPPPDFEFTVLEDQSVFVSLEASFFTTLGLAETGRITIEKQVGSSWETVSSTVDGGLLDLLGAAGTVVRGGVEFAEP